MKMEINNFVRRRAGRAEAQRRRGFSLIEVMIAAGIFFLAVFAVLSLVSQSLTNVRRLQRPLVDAGPVLAVCANTNSLVEGTYSGNMAEILGKAYGDYFWTAQIVEVATNKLFSVECVVQERGNREIISDLTTVLYRPQSPAGGLDGGNFIHR